MSDFLITLKKKKLEKLAEVLTLFVNLLTPDDNYSLSVKASV